jgi:uncharacterized membrane protein
MRRRPPLTQCVRTVLTTHAGWNLIVVGTAIGFLFAVLVLTISAISLGPSQNTRRSPAFLV